MVDDFGRNSVHFIPPLLPPYPLSKGHWGFPTLCPSTESFMTLEKHVVLPSCASADTAPEAASAPGISHSCRAQGFLKALL